MEFHSPEQQQAPQPGKGRISLPRSPRSPGSSSRIPRQSSGSAPGRGAPQFPGRSLEGEIPGIASERRGQSQEGRELRLWRLQRELRGRQEEDEENSPLGIPIPGKTGGESQGSQDKETPPGATFPGKAGEFQGAPEEETQPRKSRSRSRPLPWRSPSRERLGISEISPGDLHSQEKQEQSPPLGSHPQLPLEQDGPRRRIQVLAQPKIPGGASGMNPKVPGRSRDLLADPKIQLLEPIPGCCSRLGSLDSLFLGICPHLLPHPSLGLSRELLPGPAPNSAEFIVLKQ